MHAYKAHQGQTGRKDFARCVRHFVLRGGGNIFGAFQEYTIEIFLRWDSGATAEWRVQRREMEGDEALETERLVFWSSSFFERMYFSELLFCCFYVDLEFSLIIWLHHGWISFVSSMPGLRERFTIRPKTQNPNEIESWRWYANRVQGGGRRHRKAPERAKNENRSRRETIDPKHNCTENEDQTRSALYRTRRLEPSKKQANERSRTRK